MAVGATVNLYDCAQRIVCYLWRRAITYSADRYLTNWRARTINPTNFKTAVNKFHKETFVFRNEHLERCACFSTILSLLVYQFFYIHILLLVILYL